MRKTLATRRIATSACALGAAAALLVGCGGGSGEGGSAATGSDSAAEQGADQGSYEEESGSFSFHLPTEHIACRITPADPEIGMNSDRLSCDAPPEGYEPRDAATGMAQDTFRTRLELVALDDNGPYIDRDGSVNGADKVLPVGETLTAGDIECTAISASGYRCDSPWGGIEYDDGATTFFDEQGSEIPLQRRGY